MRRNRLSEAELIVAEKVPIFGALWPFDLSRTGAKNALAH